MAVIAWFRLPPPNPTLVKHILGPDPRPGSSGVDVGRVLPFIYYF